jgi:hypothetical protein
MSAHTNCTHPATKSARATCRKLNAAQTPDAGSYAFQDEMEKEMARTAVYLPDAEPKTHVVTRSTWKGYREITVEIDVTIWGAQPDSSVQGKIIAWGEKRLSYVSATGARNNLDVSRVKAVRALMTNV